MLQNISSRLFLNSVLKKQVFSENLQALRFLHRTALKNKKSGEFSIKDEGGSLDENTDNNKSKKSVKLYPGFQTSHEERISYEALNESNKKEQDKLSAKKAIEDFYGLNQFEYDDQQQEQEKTLVDETKDFNESVLSDSQFDIDSVTKDLRKENVRDICCIQIPEESNYADYMLIGTCLSERHMNSTFINLNKKFKKSSKRKKTDKAFLGLVVAYSNYLCTSIFIKNNVVINHKKEKNGERNKVVRARHG